MNRALPALLGVLALTGALVFGTATAASADTVTGTSGDYTFTANSSNIAAGATITAYSGGPNAVIPSEVTLDGISYSVTEVGYLGFDHLNPLGVYTGDGLTSVIIPASVTTIDNLAFANNDLTTLTLPDSVSVVGDQAFVDNQLTSLSISHSLTIINSGVFAGNKLTSVTIPDSVTTIAQNAFAYNHLVSVTIPNSVTNIKANAFLLNHLTTVTIPDSVTTIGPSAFEKNDLTSVTLSHSLTSIGSLAFYLNDLTSVVIPASVTKFGGFVFQNNNELASVTFEGAAPTTIGGYDPITYPGYPAELPPPTLWDDLGNAPGLTVYYSWPYDVSQVAGGFQTPLWLGYKAIAIIPVTFDLGGHGNAIAPESVVENDSAIQPTDPTAPGYTFNGWFTSSDFTTPADFSPEIHRPTTFYASWTANTVPTPTPTPTPVPNQNPDGPLAFTGLSINPLVIPLSAAAVLAGFALVLVTRRRRRMHRQ